MIFSLERVAGILVALKRSVRGSAESFAFIDARLRLRSCLASARSIPANKQKTLAFANVFCWSG